MRKLYPRIKYIYVTIWRFEINDFQNGISMSNTTHRLGANDIVRVKIFLTEQFYSNVNITLNKPTPYILINSHILSLVVYYYNQYHPISTPFFLSLIPLSNHLSPFLPPLSLNNFLFLLSLIFIFLYFLKTFISKWIVSLFLIYI